MSHIEVSPNAEDSQVTKVKLGGGPDAVETVVAGKALSDESLWPIVLNSGD